MKDDFSSLKQYIGNFSVVEKLSDNLFIPLEWKPLLELSGKGRVNLVIALWKSQFQQEFSVLLDVFSKHLISIELIELNKIVNMLYVFKNPKGEQLHYIGLPPLLPYQKPDKFYGRDWPAKFLDFYTHIHNGWYEVESQAMGPMPIEEFFLLSEKEWGVLDEITIDFALDKVVAVFSNSAGGYLCWNLNAAVASGLVWWDDEAPDFVDFWDILDEWCAMGIQEY
ncbi:MAG TPA: hypothetical protein VFO93_16440 [Hymenobacter sp.]|uniref:hypothetical protein n=1 Tax=Hymenobacter sp. TaxID=1898978 RepID=UPI002D7F8DF0|nr:hypothetical protein [Hymenobacter sp.]HET9505134.1 hypothetical protein [Hymenobacter sp.]